MRVLLVALVASVASVIASASVPSEVGVDARTFRGEGKATKKGDRAEAAGPFAVLATLAQTHTGERVILDTESPTQDRFDALLSDRATGQRAPLDPRLLGLLRQLAAGHVGARIELVSGYRSEKLNEMLRKKGHHVASHSQHSLGNAVDFRIIPTDEKAISPMQLEKEVRGLGWVGGIGTYMKPDDWFVHADVGGNRRWDGQ